MDSADSHHTTNAMCLDPGGATYLSDGVFHRTQVETAAGPVRNTDAAIYRFEPRTCKFERYIAYGFANPARPRVRLTGAMTLSQTRPATTITSDRRSAGGSIFRASIRA